jgi:hypothetical protein
MTRAIALSTRFVGRAVLFVALAALLLGIALAAVGVRVVTWPYRRLAGESRRAAQLALLLELATTVAAFTAVSRKSDVDG